MPPGCAFTGAAARNDGVSPGSPLREETEPLRTKAGQARVRGHRGSPVAGKRDVGANPRAAAPLYVAAALATSVRPGRSSLSGSGGDSFRASAQASAPAGLRLSTMELGIRIVAPRSFVVS